MCDALPGELAAKLALGLATEAAGDLAAAQRYLQLVLTVDPSYVSAAFGVARTRLQAGDPAGAIAALAAVPETSSYYLAAQVAAVRIQVLAQAAAAQVSPDERAGLDCVMHAGSPVGGQLLGCDFTERALRFGLERSYRAQARQAPDLRRRIELVDLANNVRPGTWS